MRTIIPELAATGENEVVNLYNDSLVAKSFAATRGLGKIRHLEVEPPWLQECLRHGKIAVQKIVGKDSVADVLTSTMVRMASRDC